MNETYAIAVPRFNGHAHSKCANMFDPRRRTVARAQACGSGMVLIRPRPPGITTGIGLLLFCVMGWAVAGCRATDPLAAWQKSLTRTVEVRGHGDPNVIRDLSSDHGHNRARPSRITFTKLDVPGAGIRPFVARSDVRGVLLGQAPVDSELWFVFIVGVVDSGASSTDALLDVRLAALTIGPEGLRWRIGARYPAPIARYAALSKRKSGASRTFPLPTDIFDMELAGGVVTVSERNTGAKWRLSLRGLSRPLNPTAVNLRDGG